MIPRTPLEEIVETADAEDRGLLDYEAPRPDPFEKWFFGSFFLLGLILFGGLTGLVWLHLAR